MHAQSTVSVSSSLRRLTARQSQKTNTFSASGYAKAWRWHTATRYTVDGFYLGGLGEEASFATARRHATSVWRTLLCTAQRNLASIVWVKEGMPATSGVAGWEANKRTGFR